MLKLKEGAFKLWNIITLVKKQVCLDQVISKNTLLSGRWQYSIQPNLIYVNETPK